MAMTTTVSEEQTNSRGAAAIARGSHRLPLGTTGMGLALLTAGAILLRILLFLGRGDFVAFDEGWYLLLGQSFWEGGGYRLTGLRHTTLSPLFPIVAGAVAGVVGSPVWAGRLVAALAGGLLVLPCWLLFRRLAGRRTAWLACLAVAVMPSLCAFTVPYWVGWDLWMGPEPVFHFFVFSGFALALRAFERESPRDWAFAGASFALAYLARPEAILITGLFGLTAFGVAAVRKPRTFALPPFVFAIAFAVCAAPYWIYLHDTLGRWTLSGRHVQLAATSRASQGGGARGTTATERIERMLWQSDDEEYARSLYGLHPSGTRLASGYWGIWPDSPDLGATTSPVPEEPGDPARGDSDGPTPWDPVPGEPVPDDAASDAGPPSGPDRVPTRLWLYFRALGVVVPAFVWPFVVIGGAARRRRRLADEAMVTGPLLASSVLIAGWVAIDPRTQLVIAPLLAFYAARGVRVLGTMFDRRRPVQGVRRGIVTAALACGVVGLMLLADVQRLYSSVTQGSPHHVLGAENRFVGEALRDVVPPGEPVMSWDPSVAIYAQRDWRVLPYASLPEIFRYATAIGCEYIVFSRFFPAPPIVRQVPANHLVIRLPRSAASMDRWRIELTEVGDRLVLGRVAFD